MHINLVVTHTDNTIGYYPLNEGRGYKVDPSMRVIRILGTPPVFIPLDNVRSWEVEKHECQH